MLSPKETASAIKAAIEGRSAYSFIRLGDGEGLLLACAFSKPEDMAYWQKTFGSGISFAELESLRSGLHRSSINADLLGLRDEVWAPAQSVETIDPQAENFHARFMAEFKLRAADVHLDLHGARRIFGLYDWHRSAASKLKGKITSSWACYDMALFHFWESLLSSIPEVTIIHCSPSLPGKIASKFPVRVRSILVPDRAAERVSRWGRTDLSAYDASEYRSVLEELTTPLRGRVFLVGAGIHGKIFIDHIKRQGGIGLDLGALLDIWDGAVTRPLVYQDKMKGDYTPEAAVDAFSLNPEKASHWEEATTPRLATKLAAAFRAAFS